MSPFAWFAIILTVGYVIYYTVMIMNDLYGKKPEEQNNTEEIDVPTTTDEAEAEEAPIEVRENDEGFSVGEEEYEANLIPEGENIEDEEVETTEGAEAAQTSKAEEICNRTDPYSEEIQAQFDDTYESIDYKALLLSEGKGKPNRPKILANPIIDEI